MNHRCRYRKASTVIPKANDSPLGTVGGHSDQGKRIVDDESRKKYFTVDHGKGQSEGGTGQENDWA